MLKRLLGKKKAERMASTTLDPNNIPRHVAIIMDGNGRWAKRRGLPRTMGHRAGAEVLKKIVRAADSVGVKALTVYGFSTENWKRPASEVSLLMNLIGEYLTGNVQDMHANNVRIRFIGHIEGLNEQLQRIIADTEALTKNNTGLTLQLAINYGGRDELVRAARYLAEKVGAGEMTAEEITEEHMAQSLYTPEFSDVDLLIRPSDDFRISNFLLWQLAYAEFWFTDICWPDFTDRVLFDAIRAYQQRERRFGGLKTEE